MKKRNAFFISLSLLFSYHLNFKDLHAESSEVTFEEIETLASSNSPLVMQLKLDSAERRGESLALGLRSNPELSAEIRPYVSEADGREVEYEVSLSQPLKLSNFGTRSKIAELMSQLSDIDAKLSLKKFSNQLLLSYAKVWALQERSQFLQQYSKRIKSISVKLNRAQQSGLISASSRKLLDSQLKKIVIEQEGLDGDILRARAELLEITGVLPQSAKFREPVLQSLPTKISLEDDSVTLKKKILASAELAREQKALASLDAYPEFAPRVGYERTADGDDRINLGFSMDLPFSDKNQVGILKAETRSKAQDAELRYLTSGQLQAQFELLLESAKKIKNQATRTKTELIPILEDAYLSSEQEFNAGQSSLLQLWQILNELDSTQSHYLELWSKSVAAQVELSIIQDNYT